LVILHGHASVSGGIFALQIEIRQDLYRHPLRPYRPIRPSEALRAFMRDAAACLSA
jgi:hypothetical protein